MEDNELKTPKSYSLDPVIIAWVAKRANRLTAENFEKGLPRVSDSQVVNDILTEAMEADKGKTSPRLTIPELNKKNKSAASVAA